jgi:predicted nuclease with TOPRIM domain
MLETISYEKELERLNQEYEEKLKQLKELEVDCVNMIEAQDQNMQPEMKQRLSEGLRKVRDYIRLFE